MIKRDLGRRALVAVGLVGSIALWPTRVRAADVDPAAAPSEAATRDEAAARVLFAEARRLAAAGKFEEACPKFEDSLRLNAGIGTTFNLADCLEHVGRIASAWARFLDVAAATKMAGQPDRERVARERAAALEPRLSRLTVNVDSPAEGMVLQRDAVVLTPSSWGMALPIDPGAHAIKVTAPGKRPWSTEVTVPAGDAVVLSVSVPTLEVLPEPPPPILVAPASPPLPAPPPERHLSRPVAILGTVGLAGMTVAAILGVEFQIANSEAKGLCQPTVCATLDDKARHDGLVNDAKTDRTIAFIGLGVGAAALATAGYFWWHSAGHGSKRTPAADLSSQPRALVHPSGAGFAIDW
jgi:hypothetical protein